DDRLADGILDALHGATAPVARQRAQERVGQRLARTYRNVVASRLHNRKTPPAPVLFPRVSRSCRIGILPFYICCRASLSPARCPPRIMPVPDVLRNMRQPLARAVLAHLFQQKIRGAWGIRGFSQIHCRARLISRAARSSP